MLRCFCCDQSAHGENTRDWTDTDQGWLCPECRKALEEVHAALNERRIPLEKVVRELKA